jgi:hypothetical protein
MKYLFFLLILFNVVFYLWETGVNRPPADSQAKTEASASQERIVLAEEQAAAPSPLPSPSPGEQPRATPPRLEASAAPTESPPPVPPPGIAEIPPAAREDARPEPEKLAQACQRLGPYDTPKQAGAILRKLGPAGRGRVKLVKKALQAETGYLILYPAADSPEAALANRKMLAEKGVKDAWVVDQGENRLAVSLAAINDKNRAEEALNRYRAQGIQAELKPRMGSIDKWWLETRDDAGRVAFEAAAQPGAGPAAAAIHPCD